MISFRIPAELEEKLSEISAIEKKTKSEIIKESIKMYIDSRKNTVSPYDLAAKYFGHSLQEQSDGSIDHSKIVRDKIKKKNND